MEIFNSIDSIYLDAVELVLKVHDSESNRFVGTAKVQNLSTFSVNNPIKGFQSIFTNKGDKLGEVFVSLRLLLPGSMLNKWYSSFLLHLSSCSLR